MDLTLCVSAESWFFTKSLNICLINLMYQEQNIIQVYQMI